MRTTPKGWEGLINSKRYLSIEKEWHVLHLLLTGDISDLGKAFPPPLAPPPLGNVVLGGTETPFDATYGKVRFLKPDEVREVADALGQVNEEDLKTRFVSDAFAEAEIYSYSHSSPGEGRDIDELEPLLYYYPLLVEFFRQASHRGEVVLLSLD